jgi:enoyl-CoA hydratase/carnithine racemase
MSSVAIDRSNKDPGIAEMVLNRVDALNAISTAHAQAIVEATTTLAADHTVRVVVLSSAAQRAFCVGADLKERHEFTDEDLKRQRTVFRAAFAGLLNLPMPTVAAVHGYALGGGLELALSCDLIVVDETATLGLPEVSVGLIPGGGGTQLLTRRVGWGHAADLVYSARRIDAAESYRLGIADRMVAAGRAREAALEMAVAIAANSPVGVRNAKSAMRLGLDASLPVGLEIEDTAWRATAFSGDRKEGIAAFNQKRHPVWPGE